MFSWSMVDLSYIYIFTEKVCMSERRANAIHDNSSFVLSYPLVAFHFFI